LQARFVIANEPKKVVFHSFHLLAEQRELVVDVSVDVANARIVEQCPGEYCEYRHTQRDHLRVRHLLEFYHFSETR